MAPTCRECRVPHVAWAQACTLQVFSLESARKAHRAGQKENISARHSSHVARRTRRVCICMHMCLYVHVLL